MNAVADARSFLVRRSSGRICMDTKSGADVQKLRPRYVSSTVSLNSGSPVTATVGFFEARVRLRLRLRSRGRFIVHYVKFFLLLTDCLFIHEGAHGDPASGLRSSVTSTCSPCKTRRVDTNMWQTSTRADTRVATRAFLTHGKKRALSGQHTVPRQHTVLW